MVRAQFTYIEMPLDPTMGAHVTETPPFGMIGVATNGVHLFGAQEAESGNALDINGTFKDAR